MIATRKEIRQLLKHHGLEYCELITKRFTTLRCTKCREKIEIGWFGGTFGTDGLIPLCQQCSLKRKSIRPTFSKKKTRHVQSRRKV